MVWAGTGSRERWRFNPPVAGQPFPAVCWIWGALGGARTAARPERVGRACERVSTRARARFCDGDPRPHRFGPGFPGVKFKPLARLKC